MPNDADTLEKSRAAAITLAANLLESVAHAKRFRRRFDPDTGPPQSSSPQGDFLFDLLRLNADYLNQFARLGNVHKDVAHRALENLYALITPSRARSDAQSLEFTNANPDQTFAI